MIFTGSELLVLISGEIVKPGLASNVCNAWRCSLESFDSKDWAFEESIWLIGFSASTLNGRAVESRTPAVTIPVTKRFFFSCISLR